MSAPVLCSRTYRRRKVAGNGLNVIRCDGIVEEVRNRAGDVMACACRRCGRIYPADHVTTKESAR